MHRFRTLSRRGLLEAGIGAALVARPATAFAAPPRPTAAIRTAHGSVQGLIENGVHTFKGVRYGAPPIGALRFKPPQPPQPWTENRAAQQYGAPAMQLVGGATAYPGSDLAAALHTIFPASSEINYDNEDCLFLNVWTPATDNGARAVIVWLHGGGFAYGSGAWPLYDGANLARRGDIVFVSVNHRLNAFGYLDLSEIGGADYAQSGNAGMLDIVLALNWVKNNIALFGGDPNNVTICGESGGGAKVSALCAMPAAQGLFHKAIIQSGPGVQAYTQDQSRASARELMRELGVTTLDGLLAAHPESIIAAAHAAAARIGGGPGGGLRLGPTIDGLTLTRHPFAPNAPPTSARVPILIGSNKDEMSLFNAGAPWFGRLTDEQLPPMFEQLVPGKGAALLAALRGAYPDYSPTYLYNAAIGASFMFGDSVRLAERKAAQRGAPVYMYQLVWDTPVFGGVFKSPHTLDIPLAFDNIDKAEVFVGQGEAPRALADQMSGAWLAFAKTGDPNHAGLPQWPAYDARRRATMFFDVSPRIVNDPLREVRRVLHG